MGLAAIGLGSNLGLASSSEKSSDTRALTLDSAVASLQTLGHVVAVSSYLDTAPVGYTDQPRFLNAAAVLQTELAPMQLLHALLQVEREHGRDRSHGIAKGPRTLDLDLLLYDDLIMQSAELTLPHPEMHARRFVLEPLVQVAPMWQHPVLHRTVADLLASTAE
jgi:2-amino-4-hydroxy-6-hydroxymethyldihydropteridine diphosphokinase